ncbi:MAG: hypothetical protein U0996_07135 [Planctomycetaceae bacterium]
MNMDNSETPTVRQGNWLRCLIARRVRWMETHLQPFVSGWRWVFFSLFAGFVPCLVAVIFQSTWHQPITAFLLTLLVIPLAGANRWREGLATIVLVFASHSVIAIAAACLDPGYAGPTFPGGPEYWDRQRLWIETGTDEEYRVRDWAPEHALLLAGTTVVSFTSFGGLTFHHGLHEVDLMNFYNGQLISFSKNGFVALALGWHLWSILRGVGYTLLSFQLVALAVQFLAMKLVCSRAEHIRHILYGLAFLLLDAGVKSVMTSWVQQRLLDNLASILPVAVFG